MHRCLESVTFLQQVAEGQVVAKTFRVPMVPFAAPESLSVALTVTCNSWIFCPLKSRVIALSITRILGHGLQQRQRAALLDGGEGGGQLGVDSGSSLVGVLSVRRYQCGKAVGVAVGTVAVLVDPGVGAFYDLDIGDRIDA